MTPESTALVVTLYVVGAPQNPRVERDVSGDDPPAPESVERGGSWELGRPSPGNVPSRSADLVANDPTKVVAVVGGHTFLRLEG